jgi:hypothetical protein
MRRLAWSCCHYRYGLGFVGHLHTFRKLRCRVSVMFIVLLLNRAV